MILLGLGIPPSVIPKDCSWHDLRVPELPEVEAIATFLGDRMAGQTIDQLKMYSISALKTSDPPLAALSAQTVQGWSRRGKFLLLDAGNVFLAVHLARAGWIRWSDELKPPTKPSLKGPLAAQLRLATGAGLSFTEQGTEKRLSIYLAREPQDVPGIARLGIDVLSDDFTPEYLAQVLSKGGNVKAALSDQSRIAGIGNAYSDEILHAAKLSPFAPTSSLKQQTIVALHEAIKAVIGEAVDRARGLQLTELKDDKRSHMKVHRREGEPCPVCGDKVRSVYYASRNFQYCPTCQTKGKVLADRRLSRLLR